MATVYRQTDADYVKHQQSSVGKCFTEAVDTLSDYFFFFTKLPLQKKKNVGNIRVIKESRNV